MKAADIMTREVLSVSPETDVSEVARLLLERRVSAVPVTDRDGRILGIVSEGDLMRRAGSAMAEAGGFLSSRTRHGTSRTFMERGLRM